MQGLETQKKAGGGGGLRDRPRGTQRHGNPKVGGDVRWPRGTGCVMGGDTQKQILGGCFILRDSQKDLEGRKNRERRL